MSREIDNPNLSVLERVMGTMKGNISEIKYEKFKWGLLFKKESMNINRP